MIHDYDYDWYTVGQHRADVITWLQRYVKDGDMPMASAELEVLEWPEPSDSQRPTHDCSGVDCLVCEAEKLGVHFTGHNMLEAPPSNDSVRKTAQFPGDSCDCKFLCSCAQNSD